uniref:hypothetical protein 51 n=1 Tax=Moniliophthora perniciosa TaxID=153609 RepID=UPI0000242360|nr:hypothetical protein 51 [Moniliophthora perniciosa]AAQ74341.1 hypothetical protein 51 [Moniliophthora perniciosa]
MHYQWASNVLAIKASRGYGCSIMLFALQCFLCAADNTSIPCFTSLHPAAFLLFCCTLLLSAPFPSSLLPAPSSFPSLRSKGRWRCG